MSYLPISVAKRTSVCLLSLSLFAACSEGSSERRLGENPGLDAGALPDGAVPGQGDAGSGGVTHKLTIAPENATLTITGKPATQQFTLELDGKKVPKAAFSVDDLLVGRIDDKGLFRSDGFVAGTVTINATYGKYEASTTLVVKANIAQVDPAVGNAQRTALDDDNALTADSDFRLLYPYDGTVFPRGLPGPFLQLGAGPADALRVSIDVGDFHYDGYFPASAPAGVTLPENVWDALTQSADGTKEVEVEVRKLDGAALIGPAKQKWRVAPGNLKGVIYYTTYKSALTNTGAVMRIKPGEEAEVMIGGCTVCHSVSAQGNVLAAAVEWAGDNPVDSTTFDLNADGSAPVRYSTDEGRTFAFAALSPDGSLAVTNGIPVIADGDPNPPRGLAGDTSSAIYDSKTGLPISAPTFTDNVKYAVSPAFSPDGTRLAFSSFDANAKGQKLLMMTASLGATPPVFGTPDLLTTVSQGIVGWPSFFADANGIVYQEGENFDTGLYGAQPSYGELRLIDAKTKSVKLLEALNGWRAANDSYLPYGDAEENRRNYEPSVLPVPVGGYYWVMFTSRRAYGHTLAPGGTVAGSDNEWGVFASGTETPSTRKKLWVAAIDLDYAGKADPSHPAFYLPGQELNAGNMRAYAALEPCRKNGQSCESGADCCDGFCRRVDDGSYACVAKPEGCSNVDETCETDADCCGVESGDTCINHRCASPVIIVQ